MSSHDQHNRQIISFSGDRRLKPIPSSKGTSDKTLMSENSLLRDQVEKERFRRKVSVYQYIVSPCSVHTSLGKICEQVKWPPGQCLSPVSVA